MSDEPKELISESGINTVLEVGRISGLTRAYKTMSRDELRNFLIKDMVMNAKELV